MLGQVPFRFDGVVRCDAFIIANGDSAIRKNAVEVDIKNLLSQPSIQEDGPIEPYRLDSQV
jgi:hypothetical protein